MLADLRTAARQLRRAPGFSLLVVLVLALGIGVNVATFGVIDALLFRPPAGVRDPGGVQRLRVDMPRTTSGVSFNNGLSLPDLDAVAARRGVFARTGAFLVNYTVVGRGAGARKVTAAVVAGDYFGVLGVRPALGRLLTPADAVGGAAGALGAVIVGRLLRAKLYGVGPLDPVSLAATAAVLAAAALLAGWLPARRAARVDPASALRAE